MQSLAGKVAVVTGASRGIGEAAAMALAEAGASVMLAARDGGQAEANAQRINAAGGKASRAAMRRLGLRGVRSWCMKPRNGLGHPMCWSTTRASSSQSAWSLTADPREWARSIEINLIGAYYAIRAVLPGMLERGRGDIINVSSGAALRPLEGWSAYCSGKAGWRC